MFQSTDEIRDYLAAESTLLTEVETRIPADLADEITNLAVAQYTLGNLVAAAAELAGILTERGTPEDVIYAESMRDYYLTRVVHIERVIEILTLEAALSAPAAPEVEYPR